MLQVLVLMIVFDAFECDFIERGHEAVRLGKNLNTLRDLDLSDNDLIGDIMYETASKLSIKYKTQQKYHGIPIFGASLVIEEEYNTLNKKAIFGKWYDKNDIDKILKNNINPLISKDDALNICLNELNIKSINYLYGKITNELYIYYYEHIPYLSYIIQFSYIDPSNPQNMYNPMCFLNANTGNIFHIYNQEYNVIEACGDGGNQRTGSYTYCDGYYSPLLISDNTSPVLFNDQIQIYDNNDFWYTYRQHEDATPIQCSLRSATNSSSRCDIHDAINGAYCVACDAFKFATTTFEMYKLLMNVSTPLAKEFMPLHLYVHVGIEWGNAVYVWGDGSINIGDGHKERYPLVTPDITAHEIAHAFTEKTSGLAYRQSGGMNEAYSDIVGECLEYYLKGSNDWSLGADTYKDGVSATRYMYDPPLDGKSIDHLSDYYDGLNSHYSSGLYNKAAYLLNTQYNWTMEQIFKVFTTANKYYWTTDCTFSEGVCGLFESLDDIYGNDTAISTIMENDLENAFSSVGLECIIPFGELCNTNTYCYYKDIYPSKNKSTSFTLPVQSKDEHITTTFLVYFTVKNEQCIYPTLSFEYELTDFDSVTNYEFIEIYDNNTNLINQCAGGWSCGVWDTSCVDDYDLGLKINADDTYIVRIFKGMGVNDLCWHDLSVNSKVTIKCDHGTLEPTTAQPTDYPTSPTSNPTSAPTIEPTTNEPTASTLGPTTTQPTIYPTGSPTTPTFVPTITHPTSSNPTTEPTTEPTVLPTDQPTTVTFVPTTVQPTTSTLSPTEFPTPAVSGSFQGTLSCGDFVSDSTTSDDYIHYYLFDLQNINGTYYVDSILFDSCGSNFDTYLYLYNSDWSLISACDDCGSSCGYQTQLIVSSLDVGIYILGITGYFSRYGDYDMQISCRNYQLQNCGNITHNIWCYYVDIFPELNIETETSVSIVNTNDRKDTYFDVFFRARNNHCIAPKITFEYELIDYDSDSEYLDVFDNDNQFIAKCNGGAICGVSERCISDYSLGINEISNGTSYKIRIFETIHVNNLCSSGITINATLTIKCLDGTESPTMEPTSPTIEPTVNPTVYPIMEPTLEPTIYTTTMIRFEGTLHCGSIVTGNTTHTDYTHYYLFNLINGVNYSVLFDSCGSDYDTYVYFYNDDWSLISYCDDCGICGLQSQLTVSPVSNGTYILGITGWGSTSVGRYTVNVTCTPNTGSVGTSSPITTTTTFTDNLCGIHTYCYYIDVYSMLTENKTFEQIIFNNNNNELTEFNVYFTGLNNICKSPIISFKYEQIDYDESNEYIDIYDNNNVLITRCGAGKYNNECGKYDECMLFNIENNININETYHIQLIESSFVDSSCSNHTYSINAIVSIKCEAIISTKISSSSTSTLTPTDTITVSNTQTIQNSDDQVNANTIDTYIIISIISSVSVICCLLIMVYLYYYQKKGRPKNQNIKEGNDKVKRAKLQKSLEMANNKNNNIIIQKVNKSQGDYMTVPVIEGDGITVSVVPNIDDDKNDVVLNQTSN